MLDDGFLRVVSFQPGEAASTLDAELRDNILPQLMHLDSVDDIWAGRRGIGDDQARVIASIWRVDPAAEPDGPPDVVALRALGDRVGLIEGVEQVPLSFHARFERSEPTRILRVFHGRVRAGDLDAYIDAARAGTLADSITNDGLIGLALGAERPDAFTTVSVWTGWSAIEMATGGNTRQPFATRNSERLSTFTVTHYEVLPDASDRRLDPA